MKITQVFKLRKLIYRFEWFFFNDKVGIAIDFMKIMMFFFFTVHWTACLFFLIQDIEIRTVKDTWIIHLNREDVKSAINTYIASASWSLTTISSTGYGDICPITDIEKCFGILAMMISCGVFSYIVGTLGSLFDRND